MNDQNPYAAPQTILQSVEDVWQDGIPHAGAYKPFALGAALLCAFVWPLDVLLLKMQWGASLFFFECSALLAFFLVTRVPKSSGARTWYFAAGIFKVALILAMAAVTWWGIPWAPSRLSQESHLADEYYIYMGIQLLIMGSLLMGNVRLNKKLEYPPLGDKNESTAICLSIAATFWVLFIGIDLWTNSRDKHETWGFPIWMATISGGLLCTSLYHAAWLPRELTRRQLESLDDETD